MRTVSRHRIAVCTLAMLGASALAGCSAEQTPAPSRTAAAPDAPVFASDEEALAAATKAYAAYLKAGDESGTGQSPKRDAFLALSTGTAHDEDLSADQLFDDRGWHTVGKTSFDSIRLQSSRKADGGNWEVRTYLCVDVSKSDVVDADGRSVVKVDRPLRLPLEVAFVAGASANLLISESKVWSGTNFC